MTSVVEKSAILIRVVQNLNARLSESGGAEIRRDIYHSSQRGFKKIEIIICMVHLIDKCWHLKVRNAFESFLDHNYKRLRVVGSFHFGCYNGNETFSFQCSQLILRSLIIFFFSNNFYGLFQRVILQSGSALAHWSLVKDPLKYAVQLATTLECPTSDKDEIMKCLRGMPVEDFLDANVQAPEHLTAFGPTIDGTVIPNEPERLMQSVQEGNNGLLHDLMFGVTSTEGSFPFGQEDFIKGFETDKRDRITRTFVRNLYTYHMNEIYAVLTNEYTDWTKGTQHPTNTRDCTMEMFGDAQYVAPVVRAGILHSMVQPNTYFYVFDYQAKDGDYPQRLGCFHGEELAYIFGAPLVEGGLTFMQKNYSKTEKTMSEAIIKFWTNFARYGEPNDIEKKVGKDVSNVEENPDNDAKNKNRFAKLAWPQFEHVHQKYLSIVN
uniref:Carboxylesterase type B domain-containing protein n=1 Tax=Strigamia maritima TaxID=126957 RepID=T1JP51_STRMM